MHSINAPDFDGEPGLPAHSFPDSLPVELGGKALIPRKTLHVERRVRVSLVDISVNLQEYAPVVEARKQHRLVNEPSWRADGDALKEPGDIVGVHSDAAVTVEVEHAGRCDGAVDSDTRNAEPNPVFSERVLGTWRHTARDRLALA